MGENVGALWTNTSQKGAEYYKGNVKFPFPVAAGQQVKIVVFANDRKEPGKPEDEKKPDYNIVLSTPKGQA